MSVLEEKAQSTLEAMLFKSFRMTLLALFVMANVPVFATEDSPSTAASLDRAGALRQEGKWVQALSEYRQMSALVLTGCDHARIQLGMASVHWHAGNVTECKPHLTEASFSCNTCPPQRRTDMALELAELMVRCGMTGEALRLLQREQDLHPLPSRVAEMEIRLLELHFAEGNWKEVWAASLDAQAPRAAGLQLQAGIMLGKPLSELPLDAYFNRLEQNNRNEVESELIHLHTMLAGMGRTQEAWQLAKRMGALHDPVTEPDAWTVAQLRIATSAERAMQPLEALLAFHEAGRVARQLEDLPLRARIAREQARFEQARGASDEALRHLALADSLTLALLHGAHQDREPRMFQSHPVLHADPFELAADEIMASSASPGAWPFACALILLGLLAAALRANELKKALRRERVRSFRMQRMIHTEADPSTEPGMALSDVAITERGRVEEMLTRPDRLDFDDIIATLEMDHGTAVEWELNSTQEGQAAPEGLLSLLSVTLKRLLEGEAKAQPFAGRIRNDWHGIHVEIEGPETASTRELQRMFAGGTHSSRWNPVLIQIEKLAGRFTIEKRGAGDLALTFMLPHASDPR